MRLSSPPPPSATQALHRSSSSSSVSGCFLAIKKISRIASDNLNHQHSLEGAHSPGPEQQLSFPHPGTKEEKAIFMKHPNSLQELYRWLYWMCEKCLAAQYLNLEAAWWVQEAEPCLHAAEASLCDFAACPAVSENHNLCLATTAEMQEGAEGCGTAQ